MLEMEQDRLQARDLALRDSQRKGKGLEAASDVKIQALERNLTMSDMEGKHTKAEAGLTCKATRAANVEKQREVTRLRFTYTMIQVIHNTYECDREYILTKHYCGINYCRGKLHGT